MYFQGLDIVSEVDVLKLIINNSCVSDKASRLFAVWCARQGLAETSVSDSRCIYACNCAEKHAFGLVDDEALHKALLQASRAAFDIGFAPNASDTELGRRMNAQQASVDVCRLNAKTAAYSTAGLLGLIKDKYWFEILNKLLSDIKTENPC